MSMRSVAARAATPSSRPRNRPEVFGIGTRTANDFRNPPTPLRVHNMQSAASTPVTMKRKRSEETPNETGSRVSAPETKTKRRKVSVADTKTQGTTRATHIVASNATPEFPNGFFYCHQCNKKRDAALGLYCTFNNKTSNLLARCRAKYCRPCLKNRYGQDSDEIKAQIAGHDKTQGYIFKCPRCSGNCNCRGCRKAMGLEPTGNLTIAAKKTGVDSVAVMLDGNAKMTAKRSINRQAKPLPKVTWTPLPVPPSFTLDRALPRIAIREFVLRFGRLLDMSRAHLEELEEIGGRRPHEVDDADSDSEQDIDVEMGWISEICLRAILLGLLNILSDSQVELGGKQGKKAIQDAIQEIKGSRANLTRIWGALASLRAEFEKVDKRLTFPDPLSPPQHTKIRTTRSGALNGAGVNVTTTAQLVPVVLPLIEMVLDTQAVHDELEEGVKEAKERVKEEKERAKAIREQWDSKKKSGNLDKAARAEYNRSLSALEQAQRVALHAHALRFSPLGIDHEGRTYFALTPSVAERDAAAALLAGDTSKGGKAHGRAIVSADERQAMRRWGWFVAVWGQKPADGLVPTNEEEDSDEESDDDSTTDVERWWGLWQADEIHKLADWIAIKNGLVGGEQPTERSAEDEPGVPTGAGSNGSRSGVQSSRLTPLSDASDTEDEAISGDGPDAGNAQTRVDEDGHVIPTQNELRALVGALREYVEVLEWRAWRMEEEPGVNGKEDDAAKKTKADVRTVSPANFYGR
ncbi:zinc-finger domain of monoamine-oxidase A repressor R1-domain-containing protein [Lactarius hengduanensis]|nr:zinc-finger domain of monoamine-oxidase A repressor R1-domain-containing protein [Lactarius hengduanensis]